MGVQSRSHARSGWVLAVVLGLLFLSTSSTGGITFEKTYGGLDKDAGLSVDQTSDAGFIVTGFVDWGDGDTLMNLYLIRTDSLGDTLWTRTYGSDSVQFEGSSVEETEDGGYFVVGYVEPGIYGYADLSAWKFSPEGDLEWEKLFGGPGHDVGHGGQQTVDGGYIIVGSAGTSELGNQMYLIKTNSSGDSLWSGVLGYPCRGAWGRSAQQTQDGGYIVAGPADLDLFHGLLLVKTNSAGLPEWQKFHDLTPFYDRAMSVEQTGDGGYIVTGFSWDWSGISEIFLLKTDGWGEEVWWKSYGNGVFADEGYSVCQTYDGGYVIAGCTELFAPGARDVYLFKTDSLGVVVWDTIFGTLGWDEGRSVQQTADSGYIIAGSAEILQRDVYLVKVDERGLIVPRRDVAVTGIKEPPDTVFINMGYDVTASVRNLGNASDSFAVTVTIDGYSDDYSVGYLGAGVEVDITFQDWLVPPDDSATYVMKVCAETEDDIDTTNDCMEKTIFAYYDPTATEESFGRPSEFGFRLCQNEPNPFHRSTMIQYSLPTQCDVTLSVYDVTGSLVGRLVDKRQGASVFRVQWIAESHADGIYFCRLQAGGFQETRKIVLVR